MPIAPTYPGVYVEEIASGVRTITGVSTSITAFVGYTVRGLDHRPKRIFSFADFERGFGGLSSESELSYSVSQFFSNGGSDAIVVRVPKGDAAAASITMVDSVAAGGKKALTLTALSKGAWGNAINVDVDYANTGSDSKAFNLTISDLATQNVETFLTVTLDSAKPNYVVAVVNDKDSGSQLVSVGVPDNTAGRPIETGVIGSDITLTDLKNDKDYTFLLTADVPEGPTKVPLLKDVIIPFLASGEDTPTSIAGVCRLIERKTNLVLQQKLPGSGIRCVPSSSGNGVRILGSFSPTLFPGAQDAKITLADGTNSPLTALKLSSPTANVAHYKLGIGRTQNSQVDAVQGSDGTKLPGTADLIGSPAKYTGIYALDKVDLFNILVIPDATRAQPGDSTKLDTAVEPNSIFSAALSFCKKRRAFLIIDPPPQVKDPDAAVDWKTSGLTVHDSFAAAYFPRIRVRDPLNNYQLRSFAPSGTVAGLYARTDSSRGIWKAPAGTEAQLNNVQGLTYKLTDAENGSINPLGLNCFRTLPVYGNVSWGARTLTGADVEGSEWKYIPVRRLALFIEESLFRGTQWVIFEPNDEPLWAQIRLNCGAFMHNLFRQGAFQGSTPKDAYIVRCDKETTTQDDINRGIVNVLVGFAPLKPAEFVFIRLQQIAGQLQS